MSTAKKVSDLSSYESILPYASELFGVYQPLLGWKSKRTSDRISKGFELDRSQLVAKAVKMLLANAKSSLPREGDPTVSIQPATTFKTRLRTHESVILSKVAESLRGRGNDQPDTWLSTITDDNVNRLLKDEVAPHYIKLLEKARKTAGRSGEVGWSEKVDGLKSEIDVMLAKESKLAGLILMLTKSKCFDALKDIFFLQSDGELSSTNLKELGATNSSDVLLDLSHLDPSIGFTNRCSSLISPVFF
jgi:hypothetical protein